MTDRCVYCKYHSSVDGLYWFKCRICLFCYDVFWIPNLLYFIVPWGDLE